MPILVDYRCTGCGGVSERWASDPVAAEADCPACGAPARRVFGLARVGTRDRAPRSAPGGAASERPALLDASLPAVCHMHPSAARRWAAMARGDDAGVAREIRYQEAAIAAGTLRPGDAMSHGHVAPFRSS